MIQRQMEELLFLEEFATKEILEKEGEKLKEREVQLEWIEKMSKQVGLLSLFQDNFEISYLNELLIAELKYDDIEDLKRHIGHSILNIVEMGEKEKFREFLLLKTEYPENPKLRCRFRCKDNSFIWYEMSRIHCIGQEQKEMLLCTLINVSKYMKSKRNQNILQMQDYFMNHVNQSVSLGFLIKRLGSKNEVLYATYNMQEFLQYTLGSDYIKEIHEEDYAAVQALLGKYEKQLPPNFELEFRVRKKGTEFIWIRAIARRLDDFISEDAYIFLFEDITKKKAMQKRLHEKEENYRVATLQNQEIVIRFDIEEKTAYIPRELAAKYSIPEVISNMPYRFIELEYILEESIVDYLKFYGKIVKGEESTVELKVKGKQGTQRWLSGKSTVRRNENGKAITAILSFRDITEKRKKEYKINKLQQSEQFFKKVAELSQRIIFKYDFLTDCFTPITKSSEKLFEKFPQPLSPLKIINANFIADEYIGEMHKAFYEMKKERKSGELCVRMRKLCEKDCWGWWRFTYHVIMDDESIPVYAIVFCDDITKMREGQLAEKCLESNSNAERGKQGTYFVYNLTLDSFEQGNGKVPIHTTYSKVFHWLCEKVSPKERGKFNRCFAKESLLQLEEGKKEVNFTFLQDKRPIYTKIIYWILKDIYTDSVILRMYFREIDKDENAEQKNADVVYKGIYIRTFGHFDIFIDGKPIPIQNAKARELLALLVDKRGGFISAEEILSILWEDEPMSTKAQAKIRQTIMILKNVLKQYTTEEVIESQRGLRRLNIDVVKCDLYDYMSGKREYASLYQGSYMPNYSWSEMTLPELNRRKIHFDENDFYEE